MTRRKRASCSANPTGHRSRERRWHGGPGHDAHEQRQGAAITRQPARGLRQSTTQLAQQQTHQAPPVQNSPCSPEMAQFGAYSACRESFVPFSPPRSQAGRILYRTRGRVGASPTAQHAPCGRRQETTGPGRGAGFGRLVGPARVGGATARQISHIISHGHFSRPPENVAIPTIQIQCLNKLLRNYVRNCYGVGYGGAWPQRPRPTEGPKSEGDKHPSKSRT